MNSYLILFLAAFFSVKLSVANAQDHSTVDTLSFLVRDAKPLDNFHFFEYKMFLLEEGKVLIKDQTKVKTIIADTRRKQEQNVLFIKVYKKKKRLLCSGLWNEEGFQGEVVFYRRNGKVQEVINFDSN